MGKIYGSALDLPQAKREERRCGRALLIGQHPSATSDPASPMIGAPGRRISLCGGVSYPHEFMTLFDRAYVLDEYPGEDLSSMADAADAMVPNLKTYQCVVLLGRPTAHAFGMGAVEWMTWKPLYGTLMAVWPRPGGSGQWWNSLVHMHRAQAWMRCLVEFLRASPTDS